MAKLTKTAIDKALRDAIFDDLMLDGGHNFDYQKINDRQYGVLLTDLNGVQRYVRIGAIVAEERDDMTAEELMMSEIKTYTDKQEAKAEKAKKKEVKIAKDKAARAKAKEEVKE